ncbi:MAG: Undecaprenyl phosphate-alpha-4-amino-4-deoxy-L-arabinose arabinosyl transferase [Desulfovibrio sp.]
MTDKKNDTEQVEPSSAFGDKAKDADALWAALAAEIPAPAADEAVSGNEAPVSDTTEPGATVSEPGVSEPSASGPSASGPSASGPDAFEAEAAESDSSESAPSEAEVFETETALSPGEAAARRFDAAFSPESDPAAETVEAAPAPSAAEGKTTPDKKKKEKKAPKPAKPKTPSVGPFNGKALGPVLPSVAMMYDEDGNLVPTPPTVTSRIFSGLSFLPILLPLVLLLAQVAFTLDTRALWYSDEVRYANAYQNMGALGNWLVLELNGMPYPDKPPMFFWLLHGLKEAAAYLGPILPFAVTETMIFFSGVALSGILCLFAAHLLASMVGRVDRRTVLAADLILVGSFFFAGLLHYLRMDVLFTAMITFSHVFLYHALVREKAPFFMLVAFLFAGAAVLVKGPLGFVFPLLAGVCFLIWQGRIVRLFRLDCIFGLLVGLAVPGVWLALAWMNAGDPFLDNILNKQILARTFKTWHHAESWYHYLMTFPLIWLPWTFLLFFLPWGRFMGKGMRAGLKASRTKDAAGIAYLWCSVLPAFILLSLVSIKLPIYCLPLFPPLAVLSARAILRMRPLAAACLQWSFAVMLALLGLCLLLLPMVPASMMPIPYIPDGTIILGGICLIFACMMAFLVKARRAESMVLLIAVFTTVFAYPVWSVTAPSLDAFLSPKTQAEVLKRYKDAGYTAASYKIYPGTYTYYAGNVTDCESFEAALAVADKEPKTILALRAKFWDKLENKPAGFAEVNRQLIAERAYVLVARPPLETVPAATPETTLETTPDAPAQTGQEPAQESARETGQEGVSAPAQDVGQEPGQEVGQPDEAAPGQEPVQEPGQESGQESASDVEAKEEAPAASEAPQSTEEPPAAAVEPPAPSTTQAQ